MGIILRSPGYVYFIVAENGLTKIGCTTNLEKRIRRLTVANPLKSRVELVIACNDAPGIERMFHDEFDSKRVKGEWFQLGEEEANFVNQYLRNVGAYQDDETKELNDKLLEFNENMV